MELREAFLQAYHAKAGQRNAAMEQVTAPLPDVEEAIQIAVLNQKGGCGKTTTVLSLSACLAEMGYSVLAIDMDPQAHLTLGLGIQGDALELTAYHLLLRPELPVTKVIQPTSHRNLKLLPSNGLLAAAQVELIPLPNRDRLLRERLEDVSRLFHLILIDCPPTLNLLTLNALTTATQLIIPIQTQYYSLDGMRELFRTVELVRQGSNPQLSVLGILPTLFDGRTKLNRAMLQAIRAYFRDQVFETTIHFNAALAECPILGQPITRYAPGSRGADDYRRLAHEVLVRAIRAHRSIERAQEPV